MDIVESGAAGVNANVDNDAMIGQILHDCGFPYWVVNSECTVVCICILDRSLGPAAIDPGTVGDKTVPMFFTFGKNCLYYWK